MTSDKIDYVFDDARFHGTRREREGQEEEEEKKVAENEWARTNSEMLCSLWCLYYIHLTLLWLCRHAGWRIIYVVLNLFIYFAFDYTSSLNHYDADI